MATVALAARANAPPAPEEVAPADATGADGRKVAPADLAPSLEAVDGVPRHPAVTITAPSIAVPIGVA